MENQNLAGKLKKFTISLILVIVIILIALIIHFELNIFLNNSEANIVFTNNFYLSQTMLVIGEPIKLIHNIASIF